jgi:hypothetical protein
MVRRAVCWGMALGLGTAWVWAVVRIVLGADVSALEGAVAAGGLSVLPVHCRPKARAAGAVGPERWVAAWRAGHVTTSRRPRSGGGSGPS